MIIFASDDRSLCYEYTLHEGVSYVCGTCETKYKTSVLARYYENEFEGKFVKLNQFKHLCEPRKYDPDKFSFEIIKKPSFKLLNFGRNLFIFDEKDPKLYYNFTRRRRVVDGYLCRRCQRANKSVFATVYRDEAGEEYVEAQMKHACQPLSNWQARC